MANYSMQDLRDVAKTRDFLICIDSDGCTFDTMETKQKECFIPNIINSFELQYISRFVREVAEYVNLYSKSRGTNRFPALVQTFDLLGERPEAIKRGYKVPELPTLRKWINEEKKLGNPALKKFVEAHPENEEMKQVLAWSEAVNESVAKLVRGVKPFPYVREALEKMQSFADVIVVSQTPTEALVREWKEHAIAPFTKIICGQEMGTKAECIAAAKEKGYNPDNVLMIGDAPGDYKAATKNDALFFPINPSREDDSWKDLYTKSLDVFKNHAYKGEYQNALLAEFDKCLPSTPWWTTAK